jgi:hypothetical protein
MFVWTSHWGHLFFFRGETFWGNGARGVTDCLSYARSRDMLADLPLSFVQGQRVQPGSKSLRAHSAIARDVLKSNTRTFLQVVVTHSSINANASFHYFFGGGE